MFSGKVLSKYEIGYYKCEACCSLQTQEPYWLDEAYSTNLADIDTGAAQRNLNNFVACYMVCKIFNLMNVIDLGGGDGLLCRLLRDRGVNCYVHDKYAVQTYGLGFTSPNFSNPDLLTAFEVVEHFENPIEDVKQLFCMRPRIVIITTGLYENYGSDWWYLAMESGQHLFFYSKQAMEIIGKCHNYRMVACKEYVLFVRNDIKDSFAAKILPVFLRRRFLKIILGLLMAFGTADSWRDHFYLKKDKTE